MFGRTLIISMVICIIAKLGVLHTSFGSFLEGGSFLSTVANYIQAIRGDIVVFYVILMGFLLNIILAKKRKKILLLSIMGLLVVICIGDLIALGVFQSRFYIRDLFGFLNRKSLSPHITYILGGTLIVSLVGIGIKLGVNKYFRIGSSPIFLLYTLTLGLLLVSIGKILSLQAKSLTDFKNIVGGISSYKYTFGYLKNLLTKKGQKKGSFYEGLTGNVQQKTYEDYFMLITGKNKQPNIILLFAESLSVVDSLYVGGLENNLPYVDKIQQQGIAFTNFMAHGCTSDTAHIATLQGVEPRTYGFFFGQKIYDKYTGADLPLAKIAQRAGYKTFFVSAVTLDFLDQRSFISQMGFENIIGEEVFKDKKKYSFDAAPDEDLYEKILEIIKNQTGQYFLAAQTISLHTPFLTPNGNGEKKALAYVDRTLGDFYENLKKQNFFENGILIVVGDHRKTTPIGYKEYEKFGKSSHGKVIAMVVGTGIASGKIFSGIAQHIDIYHSIKKYISSGVVKVRKDYTDIFELKGTRKWSVRYCNFKDKEYVITMENNKQEPDEKTKEYVLDYIKAYEQYQYENMMQKNNVQKFYTGNIQTGYDKVAGDIKVKGEKDELPHHGLSGILLFGHGGSHSGQTPYNSLEAFYKAYTQGADGIEFDVSMTKDGVNMVAHGPDVWSKECSGRVFAKYRVDEIQQKCPLSNGEKILTLDEMLQQTKHYVKQYILEIKVDNPKKGIAQANAAIESVRRAKLTGKVVFISYDEKVRLYLGTVPDIRVGWDTFDPTEVHVMKNSKYEYFLVPHQKLTPELVDKVKGYGKGLITYTPKTEEELVAAYEKGARAFLVDDVEWAAEVLKKKVDVQK